MKFILIAVCLVACSPAIPTAKQQAEVGTYEASLAACVEVSETKSEADGCMCKAATAFGRADAGLCP